MILMTYTKENINGIKIQYYMGGHVFTIRTNTLSLLEDPTIEIFSDGSNVWSSYNLEVALESLNRGVWRVIKE